MTDLATIAQALTSTLPAADAVIQTVADFKPIGKGIAYGAAAAGSGVGIGLVVAATLSGIARQPEQAGALRGLMFLGIGFIEALALIGFVLVFIL
jgi:F-type H+-transporting ATPase subunit c